MKTTKRVYQLVSEHDGKVEVINQTTRKRIKHPETANAIRVIGGGNYVTDIIEGVNLQLDNDAGEMGWFNVGNDCYRKFTRLIRAQRAKQPQLV